MIRQLCENKCFEGERKVNDFPFLTHIFCLHIVQIRRSLSLFLSHPLLFQLLQVIWDFWIVGSNSKNEKKMKRLEKQHVFGIFAKITQRILQCIAPRRLNTPTTTVVFLQSAFGFLIFSYLFFEGHGYIPKATHTRV